jgi:hypothetical protein
MTENNNCKYIYEWEKEEEFYKKKNIDFVLIEDNLINDYRFKSDRGNDCGNSKLPCTSIPSNRVKLNNIEKLSDGFLP